MSHILQTLQESQKKHFPVQRFLRITLTIFWMGADELNEIISQSMKVYL